MKVNCNYKVKLSKVFKKNTKIVLAASNISPENPVVLQSTKREAGGFQQFDLFSLNTNLELFCFEENFAAIINSDGKTPTLQSTQESKGGVF